MHPLISVIIPTSNRPTYLRRAVESALKGMAINDVEVIVVPNGPDTSWKETLQPYLESKTVRILPIETANANIARNKGLTEAKGKYVRFLDDDDYLISENAIKQYTLIQQIDADIVSGGITLVDEHGKDLAIRMQPLTEDFCTALLGPRRICIPLVHIYRRSILKDLEWNPFTTIRQDVEWQLNLCAQSELKWAKIDEVVGAWQQHWGQRISTSKCFQEAQEETVEMFLRLYKELESQKRLNTNRKNALAKGLWGCIHRTFMLKPSYWTSIAQVAKNIDPTARPIQPIYNFPYLRKVDPLIFQWFFLPKRLFSKKYRTLLKRFCLKH